MKRNLNLIALATIAFLAGPAFASDVRLYGVIDVAAVKTSENKTVMQSGGLNTSRWGIKGSEDLGGSKSVIFGLEQSVDATDGTANGFDRQSYVGLRGRAGTVSFGNVWSSMDDVVGLSNSSFDSILSASGGVLKVQELYSAGLQGAIKYVSPEFGGGFMLGLATTLKDSMDVQTSDASLSYSVGPAKVQLSHQLQNRLVDRHLTSLGGSYDLGVAKVLASYGQVREGEGKTDDYQVGVDVPYGAWTVSAGYARSEDNDVLGGDVRDGYGVAAAYALSKRTSLYGGFKKTKSEVLDLSADTYAIGIRHAF